MRRLELSPFNSPEEPKGRAGQGKSSLCLSHPLRRRISLQNSIYPLSASFRSLYASFLLLFLLLLGADGWCRSRCFGTAKRKGSNLGGRLCGEVDVYQL